MDTITIKRYDPTLAGYQGFIEPKDKSWILFVGVDGSPLFYPHRTTDGGVQCEGIGPHNTEQIKRPDGSEGYQVIPR